MDGMLIIIFNGRRPKYVCITALAHTVFILFNLVLIISMLLGKASFVVFFTLVLELFFYVAYIDPTKVSLCLASRLNFVVFCLLTNVK